MLIGTGQDEAKLRARAGPTVHFLGWQPDAAIREHYRRCRALLFPGEEDFGIVPVEAMACGTPVIALGRGGATETVVPPEENAPPTGIWFDEQSADGVIEALTRFELREGDFSPRVARRQAERFHTRRFEEEMVTYLNAVLDTETREERRAA